MATTTESAARDIVANLGGPGNISSLTHCATRLRLELNDPAQADDTALENTPGVLGVVRQGGNRYQVICGGGVESTYAAIKNLPEMKGGASDADVKAAARARGRGRFSWLDNFFEYLSDSFRPILGVLLGASLIIAIAAVLDALGVVDFRAEDKPATWVFVDAMWRSVFYFLPLMIAYNAAKKLRVDPWLGTAVMAALMTPEFMSLSDPERFADTTSAVNESLGQEFFTTEVFGIPMQLNDYGSQVFVPLLMVPILALVYHGLKKVFPENVQMVFVPFISMLIIIPLTAFLIGPLGVWLGNGIGEGLAWMNSNAPFVFAVMIPLLYPFLVPLGLHWPLNALMLVNIQTLGYDFIQGPMGVWNFACFGATAGVLALSLRDRDTQMRQTASGALAAGLFGGISEPSLYGIHLRFKRIYPRMLLGCLAGGITIAVLSAPFDGVQTQAFVFTSLLTTVVFSPMWVYAISIAVAFFVAMFAIVLTDYRTPEQRAEVKARVAAAEQAQRETAEPAPRDDAPSAVHVTAPVAGEAISLEDTGDKVFSSGALGAGLGIIPSEPTVVSPVAGTLMTVAKTGHAFGIKTDEGVEVLVHIGIDTVKMDGEGFEVAVEKKQRVEAGDLLATVDLAAIAEAGYPTTTLVTVTNTKKMSHVEPVTGGTVGAGTTVIEVQP
ncbi:glucose PTS transporter subunit IIA [Corynebacterium auris]|uniref:glucose PTS transporter subunit IIA n=1 Tax=Corynebacterium auris TaxID=44750 RepID=UPI0025B329A9|nr:glucose PTS transporter subunit IIA [Corynebacterium auris]WJY68923.1 PTS system beta-glucoside-specific EIIBCA component [Corynebacterium auris]